MIRSPLLALSDVAHGFFTREGGVSTGLYAGLNVGLGSDDDRSLVLENRARVARALGVGAEALAMPYQVHSTEVAVVDAVWAPGAGPKVDAVVTARRGIAVGIATADCGPILFADAEAGVVGAAHAGWKGAFGGVIGATVKAMEGLGAERRRIVAVLGPTISAESYEVGPEFVERFVERDAANRRFFRPSVRDGHAMFDLPAYIGRRLAEEGLGAVGDLGLCTLADEARFYSYRRATLRGEADYGRLVSAIALPERRLAVDPASLSG